MITLQIEGLRELEQAIEGTKRKLPNEVAAAVNATSRKTKTEVTKDIQVHIDNVKAASVKRRIKIGVRASRQKLWATVTVLESRRLGVGSFKGTRQTKTGVSYMTSKRSGRKIIPGGFMGAKPGIKTPKFNGQAFKRKGKARYPIGKLDAVSPWGVFLKNNLRKQTVAKAEVELRDQIQERIRVNLLRRQGLI